MLIHSVKKSTSNYFEVDFLFLLFFICNIIPSLFQRGLAESRRESNLTEKSSLQQSRSMFCRLRPIFVGKRAKYRALKTLFTSIFAP